MTQETTSTNRSSVIYLAVILLVVVTAFFIVLFIMASGSSPDTPETLTAETYMEIVTPLLENADPDAGLLYVQANECGVCHLSGGGNIAPLFEGIADRAGETHPPLTEEAYLYEAIVNPSAHIVEGYSDAMPKNYGEKLSDEELGNVIAYLLTLHAEEDSS